MIGAGELLGQRGTSLGELARRLRFGGLVLAEQQTLAHAAMFVGELLASDLRLDPRSEDIVARRLRHKVVGAGGEDLEHRIAAIVRGQRDQRNVAQRRHGLDPATRLDPRQPRHHEIEQYAIDRLDREQLDRLLARGRLDHVVTAVAQLLGDRV